MDTFLGRENTRGRDFLSYADILRVGSIRAEQPASLRRNLDDTEGETATRQRQIDSLIQEVKSLQDEKKGLLEKLRGHEGETRRLWVSITALKGTLQQKEEEVGQQRKEAEYWKKHSAVVDSNLKDARLLLQTRTAELTEAQTFLNIADKWSHGDIVRMVEHLNSEVFQAAASIADELEWNDSSCSGIAIPDQIQNNAANSISGGRLGPFFRIASSTRDPQFCVQLGLQAVMLEYAAWIVSGWGGGECANGILQTIYSDLYANESQSVAGKWRYLSRRHNRALHPDNEVIAAFLNHIMNDIYEVLLLSGAGDIPRILESMRERTLDVVKLSVELRDAIGEGVVSSEFQLLVPRPGCIFEADTMEDGYSDARGSSRSSIFRSSPKPVLLPTAIGLRRLEKGRVEGGSGITASVVLKSKIALKSLMDDMHQNERCREDDKTSKSTAQREEKMDTSS